MKTICNTSLGGIKHHTTVYIYYCNNKYISGVFHKSTNEATVNYWLTGHATMQPANQCANHLLNNQPEKRTTYQFRIAGSD
jgi:hypothetical protein